VRRVIDENITRGRNRTDGVPSDSGYIHCRNCGFIMNKKKFPRGIGDGVTTTDYSYSQGGITKYYGDPEVTGGCPFCGTFNYDREGGRR